MAFDAAALQAAIRGAQQRRGDVPGVPEAVDGRPAAWATPSGSPVSHVSYFGRQGEAHVERFPD